MKEKREKMIKQKGTFVIEERNGEKYLILEPEEQTKRILESVSPETAKQITKKPKRAGAYRFSLYLDEDLGEYVNFIKFKYKKSITDYFNEIVRADMEKNEEWKKREHNEL